MQQSGLQKVIVDTTVMEKHIATDSKLLQQVRQQLVSLAKHHGLQLHQNYHRVGATLVRKMPSHTNGCNAAEGSSKCR